MARGHGGRLGPASYAELAEHVCDMMLDGLAAEIETVGDAGVGQALAEERQHLAFPLREGGQPLRADPGGPDPQPAEQGRRRVRPLLRAEGLEGAQRGARLYHRALRFRVEQRLGEQQSAPGRLVGHLQPEEPRDRRLQVPRCGGSAAGGQGGAQQALAARPDERTAPFGSQRVERPTALRRLLGVAVPDLQFTE